MLEESTICNTNKEAMTIERQYNLVKTGWARPKIFGTNLAIDINAK